MIKNKNVLLGGLVLFSLFFIITYWAPLAGDDWGYAINGLQNNPFLLAKDFYMGWSGRYFSELYGFLVAPHKWVWNFLNPSLFVLIFISILRISNPKHSFISTLLLIFWILSVKDELRMETYTWLMGTTYVIPLALLLFFISIVFENVLKLKSMDLNQLILSAFVLFYIGLTMENISVVALFLVLVTFIYSSVRKTMIDWQWFKLTMVSLVSFLILRLSPGAALRLTRDHPEWISMSLFDQIKFNYPLFIQHTFIDNKWFTLSFTLIVIWLLYQSKLKPFIKGLLMSFLSLAIISSLSLTLSSHFDGSIFSPFTKTESLFNGLYWIFYIIILFFIVWTQLKENKRLIAILFLLAAGLSNGSMLISPIFGYRSSLFTLYFMMVVGLILFDQLTLPKYGRWVIMSSLILLIITNTVEYISKYRLVNQTHQVRLEQIQYYIDHPDEKEAWLIRYPIFTIHSGDVETWDTYHMEVFKKYYGLSQDLELIFYYPE